jgi:hypothetical protein
MVSTSKSVATSAALSVEMRTAAEAAAHARRVTLSNWIRMAIAEKLREDSARPSQPRP